MFCYAIQPVSTGSRITPYETIQWFCKDFGFILDNTVYDDNLGSKSSLTPKMTSELALLTSDFLNTTSDHPSTFRTREFTIFKDTMPVFMPVSPVSSDAATLMEGFEKHKVVGNSKGGETVALKSSFLPAGDILNPSEACGNRCRLR